MRVHDHGHCKLMPKRSDVMIASFNLQHSLSARHLPARIFSGSAGLCVALNPAAFCMDTTVITQLVHKTLTCVACDGWTGAEGVRHIVDGDG